MQKVRCAYLPAQIHADCTRLSNVNTSRENAPKATTPGRNTATYRPRLLDRVLGDYLRYRPAPCLEGIRGVGKTSTALQWATTIYRLDRHADLLALQANPEAVVDQPGPVLIDEWQRFPQVWDVVRRAVDSKSVGPFILTGSSAPKAGITTHTGAGRITSLHMRPMTLVERGCAPGGFSLEDLFDPTFDPAGQTSAMVAADYAEQIIRSGLPGLTDLPLHLISAELDSYLYRSVDVEMEGELPPRSIQTLRNWLRAYGAVSSTDTKYNEILDMATAGDSDKPAARTASQYRDRLASLWLLDPLDAWTFPGNDTTRLKRTPIHHLADPALAARLLDLTLDDLLLPASGQVLGRLFESLATLCVRAEAAARFWSVGHIRTRDGRHEVDLVVQRSAHNIIGIEVKLAQQVTDNDVQHLRWLREKLGQSCQGLYVIYTGQVAYRRNDGVVVLPLSLLG